MRRRIKYLVCHTRVIEITATLLYYTLLPIYQKVSPVNGVIALNFHDVRNDRFLEIVEHLTKNGYNIISLENMLRHFDARQMPPKKSIVITFDDGCESVYTQAFPVVIQKQIPITVYLVASTLEEAAKDENQAQPAWAVCRSFLSTREIKEMYDTGLVCFGSHTLSHPNLADLSPEASDTEIIESKKRIEQLTKLPIEHFSYPYGGKKTFSRTHVTMLQKAGYKSAAANFAGVNDCDTPRYCLKRVGIGQKHGKYVVEVSISGLLHKTVNAWY
jgi:peptidoglycan/xylan/chitin deacetylase (PgdA/CDA1 family)